MSNKGNKSDFKYESPETMELELRDIGYCCSECSSLIEILSINENNSFIEFKCSNKNNVHKKNISLKEYLEKRKLNKDFTNNKDLCNEHKENYKSYCLDCKKHLCSKCQKEGSHISHHKINIIEIEPISEGLKIIEKIIDYYEEQMNNYKRKEILLSKKMQNSLNNNKVELDNIKKNKIKEISEKKEIELIKNKEKYLEDIKLIKKKFEEEIKSRKSQYQSVNYKIINEYKLAKDKIENIYNKKEEILQKKIKDITNEFELDKKIENLNNIKIVNELVCNTYNNYPNNFYNAININKFIVHHYGNNNNIKKNIIKNILKDDCEIEINNIFKKIEFFEKESNDFKNEKLDKKKISHNAFYRINDKKSRFINNNESHLNNSNYISNRTEPNQKNNNNDREFNLLSAREREKPKLIKKCNDYNLFTILNSVFFEKQQQTVINKSIIDENLILKLKEIYIDYSKEKRQKELINYFDSFIHSNVLELFKRNDIEYRILYKLKYNLEKTLECFEFNKQYYSSYYNLKIKVKRIDSPEASKLFRRHFHIDKENIINEEDLLKKLDQNDNDLYKVFQQIYG